MVNADLCVVPLLPLTVLRVDILREEVLVRLTGQDVLDCVELCLCQTACSR